VNFSISKGDGFKIPATTAFRSAELELPRHGFGRPATIALAEPSFAAEILERGQSSEALTRDIDESRHAGLHERLSCLGAIGVCSAGRPAVF
jgi:hypothetical protein